MSTSNKNTTVKVNFKSWFVKNLPQIGIMLSVALTISLIFYFGIMKPRLKIPGKLAEIQSYASSNYSNLLQTRLSIMTFLELDTKKGDFNSARETALQNLQTYNQEGLDFLDKTTIPASIDTKVNEVKDLNDKVILKTFPELKNQSIKILKKQRGILDDLTAFDSIVANIYQYDVTVDMNVDDNAVLKDRIEGAEIGLNNINKKLKESKFAQNTENVQNQIIETTTLLSNLDTKLSNNNLSEQERNQDLNEIYTNLMELKSITLETHKGILKSESGLNMLTDLTNIMLKYEDINSKVRQTKKTLYNDGDKIF